MFARPALPARKLADWHALEGALDRWSSWGAFAVACVGAAVVLTVL
jgi:hypothetical protein